MRLFVAVLALLAAWPLRAEVGFRVAPIRAVVVHVHEEIANRAFLAPLRARLTRDPAPPVHGLPKNGSMVDASSVGTMTSAPARLTKADSGGWTLWEKSADGRPEFGDRAAFNASIPESYWASFTVTLHDTAFFDRTEAFSGSKAGTGGLDPFKDSRWLMSVVLARQPHFANQPAGVQVFRGYALHPDRIGDFVARPVSDCTGAEILQELCGHLNFDMAGTLAAARPRLRRRRSGRDDA